MAKYEKYSENFPRWEMLKSQSATRLAIKNEPDGIQEENLKALAENVLQPVRDQFGPIKVTSGFRSVELNTAIGGSKTSQHCKGEAADFEAWAPEVSNYEIAKWISENLEFDQLILEFPGPNPKDGWVHASFTRGTNRKQVLTAIKRGKRTEYIIGLNP